MSDFFRRVEGLPRLGIGVSTEYGARAAGGGLDPAELRRRYPRFAGFLVVGVEIATGLDADAQAWAAAGWPTTYHFLDLNLDEPEDFDAPWLEATRGLLDALKPAWICGDAGLWHVGARERGHMLLLPPVLCAEAADAMAEGVVRLRDATGLEVLPENPPGHVYVGDLHLLDFFARVAERADTGLLLDAAHLAIFQRVAGHDPLTALDGFPCERVVEIHVAGASSFEVDGLAMIEDDHNTAVLPDTWAILEHVVPRAPNLKAVVVECERNPIDDCLPGFERIARAWPEGAR